MAAACLEKDRYTLSSSGCIGGGLVLFYSESMLGIPDFTGQSEKDPESCSGGGHPGKASSRLRIGLLLCRAFQALAEVL